MRIEQIVLYHIRMRLKSSVSTSFGTILDKDSVVVEVRDTEGVVGWGEAPAFWTPWYSEETIRTVLLIMEDFLIPRLGNQEIGSPDQVTKIFAPIQRNNMAKAGLESAIWDLFAQRSHIPLAAAIGGARQQIEVGVVVGILPTVRDTLDLIEKYLVEGYKRVKLKIKPGKDIEFVRAIRKTFSQLPLAVDANGSYSFADISALRELDQFELMMMEQPFASGELINHAKLQAILKTPICLDESIVTFDDVKNAIALNSCRMICAKMSRLGGIAATKLVHDFCRKQDIPIMCGGMFESGIGRAHNIALSTLESFTIPGDISSSSRYWERDIIEPEVMVMQGKIAITDGPGLGYKVNMEQLEKATLAKKIFTLNA